MSGTTGASHQATAAKTFDESIGINIHTEDWSSTYGNAAHSGPNTSLIETELAYLGIDNVRDAIGYSPGVILPAYAALAQDGIKLDFFTTTGGNIESLSQELADIATLGSAVVGIEGPNESDGASNFSYNGIAGFAGVRAMQTALYQQVEASAALKNIPVLAASEGQTASFAQLGSLAAYATDANVHAYMDNFSQTVAAQVAARTTQGQITAPGRPTITTETGWPTLPTDPWGISVDEATQAKLTLDVIMDDFKAGIAKTYIYQLMDETNVEGNAWGVFNGSTAKPAATAIHNLTTILQDTSASAQTFKPGTLNYTINGLPSTGNSMLLEKANGTFDLVLWNEPPVWNSSSHTEVGAASSSVSVAFGSTFSNISVFAPLNGSSAAQSLNNVSGVTVSLSDNPVIIQLSPGAVVTPPISPPPVTPSANDTVVMAGSNAAITDASGNAWTITSGAQIAVNGTVDAVTSVVTELAYVNGTIWQENTLNLWYGETKPNDSWSAGTTTSPLAAAPAGITIPASTASVTIAVTNETINAASGNHFIFITGHADTFNLSGGAETVRDGGTGGNTFTLPAAGNGSAVFSASVLGNSDVFDLTAALKGTTWSGSASTLGSYLHAVDSGANTKLLVSATATTNASGTMLATFNNQTVGLSTILAHSTI